MHYDDVDIKINWDENLDFHSKIDWDAYEPCVIIIEGTDRTGKTTLFNKLRKYYNYKQQIIIRGPVGLKAYNKIYNRISHNDYYNRLEASLGALNAIMIYLHADQNLINKRLNDETGSEKFDIEYHQKIYEDTFNKSQIKKYKIDTTNLTMEKVAEEATNIINIHILNYCEPKL